tara:strand:- start:13126 stop:14436 length:1311 start_codon:yes stop_codon:yes gene_type:complete
LDNSLAIIVVSLIFFITIILLIVIAAAEAGISGLSRGRIRTDRLDGLSELLLDYVRQRQRILRYLSIATTAVVVAFTATFHYVVSINYTLNLQTILISAVCSFVLVAFIRQTTRSIVSIDPEKWGGRLTLPIQILQNAFSPLVWGVNMPISMVLRLLGSNDQIREANPAEELIGLIEITDDIEEPVMIEQRRMMRGIIEMSDQTVRELMTPRTDLIGISNEASIGDVMKIIGESGYSRIPLFDESIDSILGVIYAKDLLAYLRSGDMTPRLADICRPAYFVPETKRADELLADFRKDQVHLAIAIDEYGGTSGVVSVEDLLEEIVGEITDEYDIEELEVEHISKGEFLVDARMTIDELEELCHVNIEAEDFDTVGGLIFTLLGRLASPGDITSTRTEDGEIDPQGLNLRVMSVIGRRIKKVHITKANIEIENTHAD